MPMEQEKNSYSRAETKDTISLMHYNKVVKIKTNRGI